MREEWVNNMCGIAMMYDTENHKFISCVSVCGSGSVRGKMWMYKGVVNDEGVVVCVGECCWWWSVQ